MKLKNILFLIFTVSIHHINAQIPDFQWAQSIGGDTSYISSYKILTDAKGNTTILGYFNGTVDFDPSPATSIQTSKDYSIFILRMDALGNFKWVKSIAMIGSYSPIDIAIDDFGNILVTGSFMYTVDFDPGPQVNNLVAKDDKNVFILKLDKSGNFNWAKQFGGVKYDISESVTVDKMGGIYLTGEFSDTVDFDPEVGVHYLYSVGLNDVFILKLNANGSLNWVKQISGDWTSTVVKSMALDGINNIHLTGFFYGTVDFDPDSSKFMQTSIGTNMFVLKLDSIGRFIWMKNIGGYIGDDEVEGRKIIVDDFGSVHITGVFNNAIDFDPSIKVYKLSGGHSNLFFLKLDENGGFLWAKKIRTGQYNTLDEMGLSLALDQSGNVFSSGMFRGTVDFDPDSTTFNLTSNGVNDIFILKLNEFGEFIWVTKIGGAEWDEAISIAVDKNNNIYTTGYYTGLVDFNQSNGVFNLTSSGPQDMFLQKIGTTPTNTIEKINCQKFLVYPNPFSENLTIFSGKTTSNTIRIQDARLCEVLFQSFNETVTLDLCDLENGIYFYEIYSESGNIQRGKIIKN